MFKDEFGHNAKGALQRAIQTRRKSALATMVNQLYEEGQVQKRIILRDALRELEEVL